MHVLLHNNVNALYIEKKDYEKSLQQVYKLLKIIFFVKTLVLNIAYQKAVWINHHYLLINLTFLHFSFQITIDNIQVDNKKSNLYELSEDKTIDYMDTKILLISGLHYINI